MAEVNNRREIERPSQVNRSDRPNRVPINGLRDKLTVSPQEAGWHYCIVNDENVEDYKLAGYEFVTHEVRIGARKVDQASMVGGRVAIPVGNGVTGYLMRCPQEVFDEEQRLVNERTDGTEQSLRRNLQGVQDGMYGRVEVGRKLP